MNIDERKFPDMKLLMDTLDRPPGSPICEGDYEMMVLLAEAVSEETMWDYLNKRLGAIFDKINFKLDMSLKRAQEED